METIKSLLVVWKNAVNNLYYHVGTLNYNGEEYSFQYTHLSTSPRTVREAMEAGYRLHPAFPELEKTYKSASLFPAFNRRIPDETRVGYQNILDELQLPITADRMDILKETRGALAGDPYTFEEPLRLEGKKISSHFYINGMRHRNLPPEWSQLVSIGEKLKAEIDQDNPVDKYAVKICTYDDLQLGFVPGIYAQAIYALLKQGKEIDLQISELKPGHAPQWWVQVKLEAFLDFDNNEQEQREYIESFIFQETA